MNINLVKELVPNGITYDIYKKLRMTYGLSTPENKDVTSLLNNEGYIQYVRELLKKCDYHRDDDYTYTGALINTIIPQLLERLQNGTPVSQG